MEVQGGQEDARDSFAIVKVVLYPISDLPTMGLYRHIALLHVALACLMAPLGWVSRSHNSDLDSHELCQMLGGDWTANVLPYQTRKVMRDELGHERND